MKIKDLGDGNYQTYPETEGMIDVDNIEQWVEEHTPQIVKDIRRVSELKKSLNDTDYVMSQITEAEQFHPEDVLSLKSEYAPVIENRVAWRKEIQLLINRIKENKDLTNQEEQK